MRHSAKHVKTSIFDMKSFKNDPFEIDFSVLRAIFERKMAKFKNEARIDIKIQEKDSILSKKGEFLE